MVQLTEILHLIILNLKLKVGIAILKVQNAGLRLMLWILGCKVVVSRHQQLHQQNQDRLTEASMNNTQRRLHAEGRNKYWLSSSGGEMDGPVNHVTSQHQESYEE